MYAENKIFILKQLLMDWIGGVTRREIKGDSKIVSVNNLKNRVTF